MAATHQKVRVATNPHAASRPKAKKKGSHMATAGKKKNASSHHKAKAKKNYRKKPKRNPTGVAATIGHPKELVTASVAGLVSAVATRQLPQAVLGTNNTGIQGYGANFVTALLATWVAGSIGGPSAGRGALIGGMVILLDRVLSEQVSPISSYLALSGVGDATAYSKLGTIRQGWFTHPGLLDASGNLIAPDPYTDAAVQAVVAKYPQLAAPIMAASAPGGHQGKMGAVNPSALRKHVANGMVLSSRFQGRFNQ